MKKDLILFLILIACFNISKSAAINYSDSIPVKHKINIQKKNKSTSPFQGKKIFCSADNDAKYTVTIKGNNVLIVIDNKRITGVYKKDKLFTNDPEELEYRKLAPKNNYGKFYVVATDYFSVLNLENSEYRYFTLCK
jgi:hypothetical protein